MKILLFMTGYRQHEEYALQARFLARCPKLRANAELFVYNNYIQNKIEDVCRNIPLPMKIHNTDKNAGYYLGPIEAMEFLFANRDLSVYDYVLHLHPDVFVVNEEPLMKLLEEEVSTPNVFLVNSAVPNDSRFYCFDFFAFKPRLLEKSIFVNWSNWVGPCEYFLHDRIVENSIPHRLVQRYSEPGKTREIDELGLWHEHELSKIRQFLSRIERLS